MVDYPSSYQGVISTVSSKNAGNRTGHCVNKDPWNDCCVIDHPSLLPAKSQWFSVWCPLQSRLHCLQCWLACLGECLAVYQGYWWEIQTLCSAPFVSSSLLPHGWSSWRCSLCINKNTDLFLRTKAHLQHYVSHIHPCCQTLSSLKRHIEKEALSSWVHSNYPIRQKFSMLIFQDIISYTSTDGKYAKIFPEFC